MAEQPAVTEARLLGGPPPGGYEDGMGFVMEEWREGYVRYRVAIAPIHLNRQGWIHGGVLSALIDTLGLFAGNYDPATGQGRAAATVSMACNFVGGSRGPALLGEGRLVRAGRSMYFADGIITEAGTGALLATGHGAYKYR